LPEYLIYHLLHCCLSPASSVREEKGCNDTNIFFSLQVQELKFSAIVNSSSTLCKRLLFPAGELKML